MKVSFILATNKAFVGGAQTTIQSIYNADSLNIDYEIVLLSKESVDQPKVVWINDDKQLGSVRSYNYLFTQTNSDYIVLSTDDKQFDPNIFSVFYDLENNYQNHKFKIISLPIHNGYGYTNPCYLDDDCNLSGKNLVPHCIMPRFPIFHSSTIENELCGCLFNPEYRHHYADSWLGYWMWAHNQFPLEYDRACLYPFGNSSTRNDTDIDSARNVFLSMIKEHEKGDRKTYV
jgi:hypothetical protein